MTRYKTEGREITFGSLVGRNAFEVLGTIERLLKQVDRATGGSRAEEYMAKATEGDYDHLLRVSHEYAYRCLAATLSVKADFAEYVLDEDEGSEGDF